MLAVEAHLWAIILLHSDRLGGLCILLKIRNEELRAIKRNRVICHTCWVSSNAFRDSKLV